MRKVFLFVVLVGGLVLVAGLLALGAFPPHPHPHQIEKVLPNDHFTNRSG